MSLTDLGVTGAGGFGREVPDVIEALNLANGGTYSVVGMVDPNPSLVNLDRLAGRGVPYLGGEDAWLAAGGQAHFVVGIEDPTTRQCVGKHLQQAGLLAAAIVHPGATIGGLSTLGDGTVVRAGVQVSMNATVRNHVHPNSNATIGHDATLGDFVSVNPAAIGSDEVVILSGVLLGAGSVVLEGLSIGARSVVGASACVTQNVPESATVVGVPDRTTS
ncbi:MAG: acetyltransferase [Kineosporiaceae bacterium]|nr:acetyltransferase [Aeromicrobium sp.]